MRPSAESARLPRPGTAAPQDRKRTFLRMASHELRTPLNSILGFSDILAAELYGPLGAPQYKEYAEIIRGSGQKLLNLINQVLEIARLESGAVDWDLRREPLEPAIDDVLAGLAAELSERRIRVDVAGGAPLPAVTADPRGVRAVLSGLLHNAVVFSPEGSAIRIRAARRRGAVVVVIENEGDGVEPADLPRLLQPFEQGRNAAGGPGEGAGLGLTICALTCRAMGGRLTLSCAKGRGLRARVQLPAA